MIIIWFWQNIILFQWSTAHNTQSFGNSISRSINNNNVYAQNGPQYANTYSVNMPNNSNGVVVEPINNSIVDSTDFGARRAPEGKDNDSFIMDNSNISSMISSECVEIPTETFSTSDNNGKINVHVTVMINSGEHALNIQFSLIILSNIHSIFYYCCISIHIQNVYSVIHFLYDYWSIFQTLHVHLLS